MVFFIAKRPKLGPELFRQQGLHRHRRSRRRFLGGHQGVPGFPLLRLWVTLNFDLWVAMFIKFGGSPVKPIRFHHRFCRQGLGEG